MRRTILLIAALSLSGAVRAARNIPLAPLVNDPGIAYSKTYDLNVNTVDVDQLSAQATYSSATIASQTFQDGRISTATITVSTVSLTTIHGAAATNTLTVSSNALGQTQASQTLNVSTTTGLAGATISINGSVLSTPRDWAIGTSSITTAANIVTAINAKFGGFTATSSGSTVTITANAYGTQGNAYTLSSSTPTALVAGASTFSGGQANATFTLNSRLFTAGIDFAVADVSSNTAVNLVALINAQFTTVTAATSAATVVTITAASKGTAGNAYTLAEVGGLSVGGATFSGGVASAYISINGISLIEGTDWTAASTSTGTAKAISDAIVANSNLQSIVTSTWSSSLVGVSTYGVVSASATHVGTTTGYPLFSSKPAVLPWNSGIMQGGANADWTINTGVINKTSHGFTLALPVLYSTGAVAIGGLTNQTTYYVIPVTANTFELSATSTGAVAGAFLTLTSSSTVGPHTYTVAPLAISGTPSFKWQYSNDGTNFADLSVSSVTFSSPYTAASTLWDFGTYNYVYLRLKYTAGTAGAVNLLVTENGKKLYYLP